MPALPTNTPLFFEKWWGVRGEAKNFFSREKKFFSSPGSHNFLSEEAFADADQPDGEDDEGQDPLKVNAEKAGEFQPFTGIDFGIKVIQSPADAPGTEDGKHQCAEGQHIIADDKVFKVQNIAAAAERMESA